MDTLPPTSPAIAEAIDDDLRAEATLRKAHQWIQALDDRLPHAPSDPTRHEEVLQNIDLFWQSAVPPSADRSSMTTKQAFARQLARVATNDASWRLANGMLPESACLMLRSLPTDPDTRLPSHMHAEELVVGDTAYAGMFMLRSDLYPKTVLLFSSHHGWAAFSSRRDVLAHAERSLRQALAWRSELPGIAQATIESRLDGALLSGRPLITPIYAALVERMIQRHREKVEASLSETDPNAFYDASTLHDLVDLHGMEMNRSSLRHALARRLRSSGRTLTSYPTALRDDMIQAATDYEVATLRAMDAMIAGSIAPPRSMVSFVREELTEHLRHLGIDESPESISIRSRLFPQGFLKVAGTLIQGRDETLVSLIDFARWNVGANELDTLTVVGSDGTPHAKLSTNHVTAMVRSIDAGRRYIEHLDDCKGDSEQGLNYRRMARDRWLARVRFDAASARLTQYDGVPTGLLPDARERAYRWIEATLVHPEPSSRQRVDGDDLVVQQLTYLGAAVSDVFVIAARQSESSSHVVVYTPDAPDRIAFREFRTRADMVRNFLLDRSFETYLLARLPPEFTTTDVNGRTRFDVPESTKTLRWVLPNEGCGFCTALVEPFAYRDVITDIADAAYDTEREQERSLFRHVSRSTRQADEDAANQRYRIPHALAGMPGEATGFLAAMTAQSLATATNSAWRFYDNVKAGDYANAFVDAVSVYVNGLDVATIGPTPGSWSHGALRRLGKASTARRAGLSIPVEAMATTAMPSQLVPLAETHWPTHAYYHASPAELERLERVGMLILLQSRLGKGDLRGVPLVVLPSGQRPLSSPYPAGWIPTSAEGPSSSAGTWVRIDLREALRGSNLSANSFNVYRPIDGDGNVLIVRPEHRLPVMGGSAPLILFDHYAIASAPAG